MPDETPELERPRTWSGAGHTRAWASFVTCGAAVAVLILLAISKARESRGPRSDIGHASPDAIGDFLYMVLVLGIAGVGLLLAASARREAPGDPLVELALGTSILTLIVLFALGPLVLQMVS